MSGNIEKTALIIEDDKDICSLIAIVLQMQEIRAMQANSIEEAQKLITDILPSLIFVDHRLPDGFGFDMVPGLRLKFPDAVIIAMTAEHNAEMETLSYQNGVDHYLEKPFKIAVLSEMVDRIFNA